MNVFEQDPGMPKPTWVMYGFEKDDGTVQVWASRDVVSADAPMPEIPEYGLPNIRLDVTLKRMTMTAGQNWGEAFAHLFRRWSPDADRPAIETARELEGI